MKLNCMKYLFSITVGISSITSVSLSRSAPLFSERYKEDDFGPGSCNPLTRSIRNIE